MARSMRRVPPQFCAGWLCKAGRSRQLSGVVRAPSASESWPSMMEVATMRIGSRACLCLLFAISVASPAALSSGVPAELGQHERVLVVDKTKARAQLFQNGALARFYEIGLSQAAGRKEKEGDLKMPEGQYRVVEKLRGPFDAGGDWSKAHQRWLEKRREPRPGLGLRVHARCGPRRGVRHPATRRRRAHSALSCQGCMPFHGNTPHATLKPR